MICEVDFVVVVINTNQRIFTAYIFKPPKVCTRIVTCGALDTEPAREKIRYDYINWQ